MPYVYVCTQRDTSTQTDDALLVFYALMFISRSQSNDRGLCFAMTSLHSVLDGLQSIHFILTIELAIP